MASSEDSSVIFVSRIRKLPLLDTDQEQVGRMDDVVIAPIHGMHSPHVLGFVAVVQRRKIFVSGSRVASVSVHGVQLRGSTIDLHPFEQRPSELLASKDLLDARIDGDIVNDIALRKVTNKPWTFEVESVSLRTPGPLRRRAHTRVAPWKEAAQLFDRGLVGGELAAMQELHPSDVAAALRSMPADRRRQLAEAMDDERLADLLEELPEEEQVALVENLDLDRVADVLEEMDPDDAADLLGEMPLPMRTRMLDAMDNEDAELIRRLLLYDARSAGGVMTPAPVIVPPSASVAEALARLRNSDVPASLAAQVFVAELPTQPPTGRYIGVVGFQRLLRESPSAQVVDCIEETAAPVQPHMAELAVAERLAAYDLFALPVLDDAGRLLGVVTIDDVLDHALPQNWRSEYQETKT